jgi:potassium-dependent mechanosensitive channel
MTKSLENSWRRRAKGWLRLDVVLLGWAALMPPSLLNHAAPAVPGLSASSLLTNATASPAVESMAGTVEMRLAEARASLAALGGAGFTNPPAGGTLQDLWMRRASLDRLVRLYEQQVSNGAALEKAKARRAGIAREAQAWTRFSEPPPYSVLVTDRLREEIQVEREGISHGEVAAASLGQMMQEHRAALAEAEEKLRQLNEQLETGGEGAATAPLTAQRERERLRSQLAAASMAVFESERLVREEELAGRRLRLTLLQRQLILAQAGATFTQVDLEKVVSQIERQREQLDRELADAQPRQAAAVKALAAAQEEVRLRLTGDLRAGDRSEQWLAVRQAQLDAADAAAQVLRALLEGANIERTMWELRFLAFESRSVHTLRDSERRLAVFSRRLALWLDFARQQLEDCSSQLQLEEARLQELSPDSDLRPLSRERLDALRDRERMLLRFVRGVERMARLSARWNEEMRAAEVKLPLASRVRNVFYDARSFGQRLWTFEVFAAEDTITVDGQKITGRRSVTIGKVVMALVILVVGYWVTGLLTALMEPMIVKRLKIEPNEASLIRRWLRALLVVCLLLFSLISVKIPLTVFAFAGGALAIGLGFGTQTLLKNFVSGLILLFERPFRVGDVLDVGGQKGAVSSIGLRASVLQLWDGTETLIPNSSLLENNVTNWTYTNRKVRFSVSVGVAYGSDPRRVIKILSEILERHGLVEKDPKPQILFTALGESTLNFELRFWLDVFATNPAQVSSDVRLMIVGALTEQGIQIAFPQRDVHLDTSRPLQVEVVPPPISGKGPPEAPG